MGAGDSWFRHEYSLEDVEKLLGLHEHPGPRAPRDVTVLDLISWAHDPGGDLTWQRLHEFDSDGWMARRGPLAPHSDAATVLWDFVRAVDRLQLHEQAVVALTIFGFSQAEIAAILPDEHGGRLTQQRVGRIVRGRPKRDATGAPVKDDAGDVVMTGGIVHKVAKAMNGGHDAQ